MDVLVARAGHRFERSLAGDGVTSVSLISSHPDSPLIMPRPSFTAPKLPEATRSYLLASQVRTSATSWCNVDDCLQDPVVQAARAGMNRRDTSPRDPAAHLGDALSAISAISAMISASESGGSRAHRQRDRGAVDERGAFAGQVAEMNRRDGPVEMGGPRRRAVMTALYSCRF